MRELRVLQVLTDLDYEQLDPGIRATVRWLREHGFETVDSGDGSKAAHMECALDVPNVFIRVAPEKLVAEADRLRDLLAEAGWPTVSIGTVDGPGEHAAAEIQGSYDPADGSATLTLLYFKL